jgi:hypothetical protein
VMLTLARRLLPSSALGKLNMIAHAPAPSVMIDQKLHDRLVEYYELDIRELSPFLGGKTPNWFGKSLPSSVIS